MSTKFKITEHIVANTLFLDADVEPEKKKKKIHCWILEWDFGKKDSALPVLIPWLRELYSCYVEKYPLF